MIDYQAYGIKGDGCHDDTVGLQRLFNDYYHIVLPARTFLISRPLTVKNGRRIEGSGRYTQILSYTGDHSFFAINGSCDVHISNLSTYVAEIAPDDEITTFAAVYITGINEKCQDITIENLDIRNKRGRGVVVTDGNDRVTIRDCTIHESTIGVFVFKDNRDVDIIHNRIIEPKLIGVYVDDAAEGDTAETSKPNYRTRIQDNTIERGGTHPQNTGFGIAVSGSQHTLIKNNFINEIGERCTGAGGIVLNCGQHGYNQGMYTTVESNHVMYSGSAGLLIVGNRHVQVRGNVFANNNQAKTQKYEYAEAEVVIRNQGDMMQSEMIDINHNHLIRSMGVRSWSTIGVDSWPSSRVSICNNEYEGISIPVRRA